MATVRSDELIFRAGGAVMSRHGVLRKRTAPVEDVAETFSRSSKASIFDRANVVRQCANNVPRISWEDRDNDGINETPTIPLSAALTQLVEFSIPGGSDSSFETIPLGVLKPSLLGEYAINIETGDRFERDLPANHTRDTFEIGVTVVPQFASDDGIAHTLCELKKDANNFLRVRKLATGLLELSGTVNTVALTPATLTPGAPWAAGAVSFFGFRVSAVTARLLYDTNADGTLDGATISSIGGFAAGTYTLALGAQVGGAEQGLGAYNVVVTSTGSQTPLDDRYGSGSGGALGPVLGRIISGDSVASHLVLHIGADASVPRLDTYQGATDGLVGTATGRVSLNGTTQYVNNGNRTAFNAINKFWVLFEVERTSGGRIDPIFTRWDTGDVTKQQFRMLFGATDAFAARMGDGAGNDYVITTNASTFLAGWRGMGLLRVDLTQVTDAARVKFDVSAYDATTGKYAAWTQPTLGFSGAAPATLITVATLNLLVGAMTNGAGISDFFSGKVDTIAYGMVSSPAGMPSDTIRDLVTAGEVGPLITHQVGNGGMFFYDGDAVDQMFTNNGTLVGSPSFVDDGRTGLGRFEKYAKRGRLVFNRQSSRNVDLGNCIDLDGARSATFFGVFTPAGADPAINSGATLLSVYDGTDSTKRCFAILWTVGGATVYFQTSWWNPGLGSEAQVNTPANSLVQGTEYAYVVRYDGKQSTNATKVRIWLAARDRTTGLFGTLTEQTTSGSGTVPTSLTAVGSTTKMYVGRFNDGQAQASGFIDDTRVWANDALDPTALTSILLYQERDGMASASVRSPDRWWTLDNTGNDRTYAGSRMTQVIRPSFARASTVGKQLYSDGVLRAVASGELRNKSWFLGNDAVDRVATVIQRPFTNLVGQDDVSAWSSTGTPTVTTAISDPAGGTGAYRVVNNDGLGDTNKNRSVTLTGNGIKTAVFVVRQATMPGTGSQQVALYDSTASASRILVTITGWVGGKPTVTMTQGVLLGMRLLGNGYWALYTQSESVTAANGHLVFIDPATAAGNATASIDVYRVNVFNDVLPSEIILDASQTSTTENLNLGSITQQAMSVVWEGIALDITNQGATYYHLFNVGAPDDPTKGGLGVYFDISTNQIATKFWNLHTGAASVSAVTPSVALKRYDRLRVLATVSATGVTQIVVEVNGTQTTGSASGANGTVDSGSSTDPLLHVGYANVGAVNQPVMAVTQIKVQSQVKSFAQMDAIFRPDLAHYQVGQQTADVDGTLNSPIHWFDARQPSGWSFGSGAEFDRATGTNQVNDATYGFRVKRVNTDTDALFVTSGTAAVGDLVVWASTARATTATINLAKTETGAFSTTHNVAVPVQGTLAVVGRADRAENVGTVTVNVRISGAAAEAYLDSMVAVKFAPLSASVATKGTAYPAIGGNGGAYGVAIASIVTPDGTLVLNGFDAGMSVAQGQKVIKLDTGVSGTHARGYRLGAVGGMNGLAPSTWHSVLVGVFLKSTSAIGVANVKVRIVDEAGNTASSAMTAKGRWQWLSVQRQIGTAQAYIEIQCEDGTNFGTANDALYIALPTVAAQRCVPYPIANDAEGTITQAVEAVSFAFAPSPQALTVYVKLMERGSVFSATGGMLEIGNGIVSGKTRLLIYCTGDGNYRAQINDGTTSLESTVTGATLGQGAELCVQINADGSIQLFVSIAAGATTSGSVTSAQALKSTWSASQIAFGAGSVGTGLTSGDDLKIALGVHTMDEMRAAA